MMGVFAHKQKATEKTGAGKSGRVFSRQGGGGHYVLQLQKRIGNQGILRLLETGVLQPKVMIGQPENRYEREADEVMGMGGGNIFTESSLNKQQDMIQTKSLFTLNKTGCLKDPAARQYSFNTLTEKQLLAYELVHVLRQNGAVETTKSPTIMRTCDCSNPREHPLQSTSDFLRQRFPALTLGTYCLTEPVHSRYNCYGHSLRSFRTIAEQEIIEQYGGRSYGGENSILYSDLHSFYASRDYIPQRYWQDCLVIAYGTGTTPKHVARRSNIRCHGRYIYESKLGLDGPEVSHYPEQLEGSYYGTVQWGYIRGRLSETPDFPTMIPYQLPQRFIHSSKLENRIMLSPLDTPQYPTRTPYRQPLRGWQYLDPSLPGIILKIIRYDGSQNIPSRDLVRHIYHHCGIRVRFHVLAHMNRQDTLNDLNGDTNLNLGPDLQSSDEVHNILSRIGPVANNEVPVVFVENIIDQRYRTPAGRNTFGVLCAISNNTSYPAVVLAHEVGHYFLGQGHASDQQRLMYGTPTNQSTILSTRECSTILSII